MANGFPIANRVEITISGIASTAETVDTLTEKIRDQQVELMAALTKVLAITEIKVTILD